MAIGEAILRVIAPVPRCVVTTRNPDSGATDVRVLHALARLRGKNDITFGVWCDIIRPGRIHIGDLVTGPELARCDLFPAGLYGGAMASWWHRDVIAAGKLPLMLCFLAFVLTFAPTRTITRMIRDGRGPFRNQVTASGTHIHHSVPGLILLIIGAFTAIASPGSLGWRCFAGLAVGIGTSLVLDEFALILHLQDVYWSGEGQLSVEAVSLTAACLGLALVGFSPFGVKDVDGIELSLRLTATGILIADFVLAFICVLKGKYRSALFGLFLPPVGVIGALRLARPSSIWAGIATRAGAWNARRVVPPPSTALGPDD